MHAEICFSAYQNIFQTFKKKRNSVLQNLFCNMLNFYIPFGAAFFIFE